MSTFSELGAYHHWVQDEWESFQLGEAGPLILSKEGYREFRPSQELWCRWFNHSDLLYGEFLGSLGGKARVSTKYDVDNLGVVLIFVAARVVYVVLFLSFLLIILVERFGDESLCKAVALPSGVLGVQVPWELLVEDLDEALLHVVRLLATRLALLLLVLLVCRDLHHVMKVCNGLGLISFEVPI